MGSLEQLYQQVILDHAREKHGEGDPTGMDASSHQVNPTCGDEATIHVEVSDDEPHTIQRLVWDGHGCSISQASLSVMVDLVEGKSVDEAMHLADTFHRLMESRGKGLDDEHAEEELEDGIVFQGVSKYPMRIKCALLGWEGMKDSVAKALAAKS